jgi:hypothetical protein
MKSSIFWDITPCSQFKVNWRFRGACRLHLQGQRIRQARNRCESRWQAELLYIDTHYVDLWISFTARSKLQDYPLTKLKAGSTADHVFPSYFPHSSETVHTRLQTNYCPRYTMTTDMQVSTQIFISINSKHWENKETQTPLWNS